MDRKAQRRKFCKGRHIESRNHPYDGILIKSCTFDQASLTKRPKIAKHLQNPAPAKIPKSRDPEIDGSPLAWRFSACDKGGPFVWITLEHGEPFKEVMERLHEFETKSWDEIIRTGSHPIEVYKCEKDAKDRLAEIQQDDIDELMSFRISGKKRVWSVKDRNIMKVLWWDPDHAICPAQRGQGTF